MALLAVQVPGGAAFAQIVRIGPEFKVNQYVVGYQSYPKVGRDGSGNFIVVWDSDRQDGSLNGIFARRFRSNGTPAGPEFRVNTYTRSYQTKPSVAADNTGYFVVAWQSYRQDGSYYGAFGRRYDFTGFPQDTPEFQVSSYTVYDQYRAVVAKEPTGRFLVVWQDNSRDGDSLGVYAQRYDSLGVKQGSGFRVNTATASSQGMPSTARDNAGNFVVAWQSYLQDGSGWGIFGQKFLNNGSKNGGEFRVSTTTAGSQTYPAVAVSGAGIFVVVWEDPGLDGSGAGIFGQRYNSAGSKVGGEFAVNTTTTGDQRGAEIGMDGSGNFVVVWHSFAQDGDGYGVFGQRFLSAGTKRGAEFPVNTYTTSAQSSPAVAADGQGNFVVVWQSFGQDGGGYGVFGQKFSMADCPALTASGPADQSACEGGEAVLFVTAAGTQPLTYQWRKNGIDVSDGPFRFGSNTATLRITQMSAIDEASYDCVVTDFCLPSGTLTSAPAQLTLNPAPSIGPVEGLTAAKVAGGASIEFHWADLAGAEDYVVLEDTDPTGPFATMTGSSANGAAGLTVPLDPVTRFYLVAGRTTECGIGPRR